MFVVKGYYMQRKGECQTGMELVRTVPAVLGFENLCDEELTSVKYRYSGMLFVTLKPFYI